MARILIITIGSRGDIQPFVALGKGMQAAGHTVAVQTPEAYRRFVEENGLTYAHMGNEFMELTESKAGQAATEGGGKGFGLIKKVMPILRAMLEDEWRVAQNFRPDLILYHPKSLGSFHIAEKLNIPAVMSLSLPLYTPTRAYPVPVLPGLRLGGGVNRFSYKLLAMATAPYAGIINDFRVNTLGLDKRGRFAGDMVRSDGSPVPVLYSYSAHVLPVPDDYPDHVQVTGYWFLDGGDSWQPNPALVEFLKAGPPPVYVGFGSMSGTNAAERGRIVTQALINSGQRGLLASGWGGLKASELPATIHMLDQAPHDWLFPQVSAVVHHGGAGTTAAGLRAGKPSLIVPFIADQPFWGAVVHQIGAGPQPIAQNKLTVENLTQALREMADSSAMRQRAEAVGTQIRAEDGIARAIQVLERILA
jgi:sterol 3beta-glucosyltransferase